MNKYKARPLWERGSKITPPNDKHIDVESIKKIQDSLPVQETPVMNNQVRNNKQAEDPTRFKITRNWIRENIMKRGTLLPEECKVIGIEINKGWISRLVGAYIDYSSKSLFEKMVRQRKKIKKQPKKKIPKNVKNTKDNFLKYKFCIDKKVTKKGKELTLNPFGYPLIIVNGVMTLEHWHVSNSYDGPPPNGYHIHHCNLDKTDNRIDNLVQIPGKLHELIHKVTNNVKKLMPSKKEILEIYLPEFISGRSDLINSIRTNYLRDRRANRKPRVSRKVEVTA